MTGPGRPCARTFALSVGASGATALLLGALWASGRTPDQVVPDVARRLGARLALRSSVAPAAPADAEAAAAEHIGYFLRSVEVGSSAGGALALGPKDVEVLEGVSHYRLLPGLFPSNMGYHFDGLATVLQFNFSAGKVSYTARAYKSGAEEHWKSCIYFGTGTGPTLGYKPCITNPAVNLLPIEGNLWLTIDTARWGRVDPGSLETFPDSVDVPSTVLNAHPACDPVTRDCFVQYTCGKAMVPLTDQACMALLRNQPDGKLKTEEVSRVTLPKNKLIQHSHSPCITQGYLVSKLDAFTERNPVNLNSGLLKALHQDEDNLWMVMDRKSNKSRVMTSTVSFVNNHFWNCFEDPANGDVVVDAVAATEDYLDNYFERNLNKPAVNWTNLFHPALRCRIPAQGTQISCEPFFPPGVQQHLFDYPTFNPNFKMNAGYKYFYAIAPQSGTSRWFDQLIKVDTGLRDVVLSWSAPGVYMTEADFVPRHKHFRTTASSSVADPPLPEEEDDGMLISIVYNATSDKSGLAIFDAKTLQLIDLHDLNFVVPFHAHGIVCATGGRNCYTNP